MAQIRRRKADKKNTSASNDSPQLARACALALDAKKGEKIVILDIRKLSQVADYFVIASGGNPRQLQAMGQAVQDAMAAAGKRPIGIEGASHDRWVLLDYGDVVIHLFDPEWRTLYDLELLWGDAPRLSFST